MQRILTIGVYGWTAEAWLAALRAAACDAVLDIRARRGVRGPEFAFANRRRLEAMLADAGIGYRHLPELAPTPGIIAVQARVDAVTLARRRDRTTLSPAFVERYEAEIANRVDWRSLAEGVDARRPALLCVERVPGACHRSIVADRLGSAAGVPVEHLVPQPGGLPAPPPHHQPTKEAKR